MASLEDAAKAHSFKLALLGEMMVWLAQAVADFKDYACRCAKGSVWERGVIAEKTFGATTLRVSDVRSSKRAISKGTQTVRRNTLRLTVDTLDGDTCAALLALIDSLISRSSVKTTYTIGGRRTSFTCTLQVKNF